MDCNCPQIPQPGAVTILPDTTQTTAVTMPDPFADIEALIATDPQPVLDLGLPFDPFAPTLADIDGLLNASTLNMINPNPGYSADYDTFNNELDWVADA